MFSENINNLFYTASACHPNDYSSVFNCVLFETFPQSQFYAVYPATKRVVCRRRATSAWTLTLRRKANALLVFDVRPADDISDATLRARADKEMRAILRQYKRKDTTVPKITGLSCFGTKFRVYEYNVSTKAIIPKSTQAVPLELWEHDFSTCDGAQTFENLALEIMTLAKDVPDNQKPRNEKLRNEKLRNKKLRNEAVSRKNNTKRHNRLL